MNLIKRYSNRKLYNTESKCYITLNDIAELIKTGVDLQVVDNATGKDVTEKILIQIILASGKETKDLMPRSFMAELIRSGIKPVSSFHSAILDYLNQNRMLDLPSRQDILELAARIDELEKSLTTTKTHSGNSQ
jgi:polyhydroxyalkanoate synthesis repressor PhaR